MSARGHADAAIGRRAFRQVRIGALVVALAFGAMVASTAIAYVASYPTPESRKGIVAAVGSDTGLAVLLGTTAHVDTVGGYTVYKIFVTLTSIGAIWGLLVATRLLRGEEDSGRWHLALAGATTARRATAATLAGLGAAVAVVFLGTAAFTLVAARRPGVGFGVADCLLYAVSLAIAPAVFVGVGALTSQLARTRRRATGLGMAVFAVTFVLRMLADAGPGTRWLAWLTPFGWTELVQPFTQNRVLPLLPAALAVIALCAGAIALASRRDAGDGVLASTDASRVRPFGLGSPLGLAARLELPSLLAWCAGAAVAGLGLGVIAKLTTSGAPPASATDMLSKFGIPGSFAAQYFGVAFLIVATIVALIPAGQLGAAAEEHTAGRLTLLVAAPTTRAGWLVGRLVLCVGAIVAAGLLAGVGAWAGAVSQGVNLDLGPLVGAGLNVVPTALVALGLGSLVLSVAPRAAAATVYVVILWSVTVDLVGSLIPASSALRSASLFRWMALAPAQDPSLSTVTITTAIGVALCVLATLVFVRRDLPTA